MVAVQGSALEALLILTASTILSPEADQLAEFKRRRQIERRLDILQAGIEREMAKPYRGRLLALLKEARQLKLERNRNMHNQWGGAGDDPINAPIADTNFSMLPTERYFSWKLDFARIKKTALEIENVTYGWTMALIDGEVGKPNILMSEAIKRKMLRAESSLSPPAPGRSRGA